MMRSFKAFRFSRYIETPMELMKLGCFIRTVVWWFVSYMVR